MQIDITQIILAFIALLSAIVTGFVIPWLKKKISVEEGKVSELAATLVKLAIDTAVRAAEQIYNSDEGKAKKEYVINVLKEQGYDVESEAIDAAIEAAVLELHRILE